MSTHNLCFGAKIRKNVYPCKPQFYYTKVGCKGVFVRRTCFRDAFFCRKQLPSLVDLRRASCQLLAKQWALNTGKLPLEGLPRNSVVKQLTVPT